VAWPWLRNGVVGGGARELARRLTGALRQAGAAQNTNAIAQMGRRLDGLPEGGGAKTNTLRTPAHSLENWMGRRHFAQK